MPEPTINTHEAINNIDNAIDKIDVVEADSKKGTRYKFIRLTLVDGQHVNWYPFLRSTVPQLEALNEQHRK